MENNYCVYKHTAPNGKVYIGITKQEPNARWGLDGARYKKNRHFWNAIRKYGWDNIAHEVVSDGLSNERAGELEKQLIALYGSTDPAKGYNNTSGGEKGYQLSGQARLVLSDATKKKWQDQTWRDKQISRRTSEEFRNLQAEISKRTWKDDATRERHISKLRENWSDAAFRERQQVAMKDPVRLSKLAKAQKDRWKNDSNYREKMREVSQKRWLDPSEHEKFTAQLRARWKDENYRAMHTGGNSPIAKAVEQYGVDGTLIATYSSLTEAAAAIGKNDCGHISACATGKRKTAYGYVWKRAGADKVV